MMEQSIQSKENLTYLINKSITNKDNYKLWKSGLEDGKSEFWDGYQDCGNRGNYAMAFNNPYWDDSTFVPKYDINGTITHAFQNSRITNLKYLMEKNNVKFNFKWKPVGSTSILSGCDIDKPFDGSTITHLPVIDLSFSSPLGAMGVATNMFCGMEHLEYIELIKVESGVGRDPSRSTLSGAETFARCYSLKELRIEGTLVESIYLEDSPNLSKESLTSIKKALASGIGQRVLQIGETNKAKFSESEIAEIESKGWRVI